MNEGFQLDARLRADTLSLGDLPLCRALLHNDCRYPWLILVPRVAGVREIIELDDAQRAQLWQESLQASEVLWRLFPGDKLNLGALGNLVPQLHLHHIVRRRDDPAWPGPVWGHSAALPYAADQARAVLDQLRRALALSD